MKRPSDQELPSELRDELARSRRAGHDYDVLAKLPQLRAALGAAEPPADGASAEHGPASQTGVHVAASAWKLVLLAAALGATVFAVWPAHRPAVPERPALTDRHAEPVAPPPPAAREPEPSVSAAEATAKETPAHELAAPQPAQNPQPAERSSRREIAQLVRIRALLERDPTAAYRLAQRSEREFPHGLLSEERQALQILALAKTGATEAAERNAQAFFARYPQSPMRERLEAALRR